MEMTNQAMGKSAHRYRPFLGSMFLIMMDSQRKRSNVIKMNTTASLLTLDVLRTVFSRNGLPTTIVSDSGPQFNSRKFEDFLSTNGTQHVKTASYHPYSN